MNLVYDKSTLNDIFIKAIDSPICHSLFDYWAINPHADERDIAFKAQSLQPIQKCSAKPGSFGNHAAQLKPFARRN